MDASRPDGHAVVLFDGVCNLCNASVRFIIARDSPGRFRFAPLDSDAARERLKSSGVTGPLPNSLVLIEDNHAYLRSTAALRIARRLRFPWPLLYGFIALPRRLRDWLYDRIARNRYRWFGKRETCAVPSPETRARFLE